MSDLQEFWVADHRCLKIYRVVEAADVVVPAGASEAFQGGRVYEVHPDDLAAGYLPFETSKDGRYAAGVLTPSAQGELLVAGDCRVRLALDKSKGEASRRLSWGAIASKYGPYRWEAQLGEDLALASLHREGTPPAHSKKTLGGSFRSWHDADILRLMLDSIARYKGRVLWGLCQDRVSLYAELARCRLEDKRAEQKRRSAPVAVLPPMVNALVKHRWKDVRLDGMAALLPSLSKVACQLVYGSDSLGTREDFLSSVQEAVRLGVLSESGAWKDPRIVETSIEIYRSHLFRRFIADCAGSVLPAADISSASVKHKQLLVLSSALRAGCSLPHWYHDHARTHTPYTPTHALRA